VPEAVGVLFERTVQGFGEMFRQLSFAEIKGSAMQSRALAGLANRTLICCLPGSTGACRWAGKACPGSARRPHQAVQLCLPSLRAFDEPDHPT
jgi:molybdopterin biosynthesis enzyme MoaB